MICGGSGGGGMLACRRSETRAATCSSISPVISGATVCTCTLAFSRSASSSATWPATSLDTCGGGTGSMRMLLFNRSATKSAMWSSIPSVIFGAAGSTRMLFVSRSDTIDAM